MPSLGFRPAGGGKGLSLFGHVALLCAAVSLPLLLFSAYLLSRAEIAERARLEQLAADYATDMARLVEHDVDAMVAVVQVLALDSSLRAADLAAFHQYASTVRPLQDSIVVLRDPDGNPIMNTRVPLGTPLPSGADLKDIDRAAMASGLPQVSNLFVGPLSGEKLFLVEVPVARDGQAAYLLSLGMPVARLGELMANNRLPPGWWYTLIGGDGVVLARTLAPESFIGVSVLPAAREAIARAAPSASTVMRSPEGIDNFAALHRVRGTPWTVAVAVPTDTLLAPLHRWLWGVGLLATLALAVSACAAVLYGGMISRGVGRLTAAAQALGRGTPVPQLHTPVHDINAAGLALLAAEGELTVRAAERDASLRAVSAARHAAEAASAAKSSFLAAISHDLRQPFQALRLFHQMLEMQAPPELGVVVENMGQALHSGEELLAALAEVSVIEAGRVRAHPADFAVDELLAEIVEECLPMAQGRGLALKRVRSTARVHSDRALLRRMVRNLVVNAVRYTEDGTVLLGCRRRGDRLRILVVDTGIGIAADKLERIFEDFYQIANPARERSQGLGLGLSIVSRLATLLDHRIGVASEPGKGSMFAIEVPLVTAPAPAPAPTAVPAPA
jgi:signal transduction histidine kinase